MSTPDRSCRRAVLTAAMTLSLVSPVLAARRAPCPPGRFLVEGGGRLVESGRAVRPDAVILGEGHVAVASGCGRRAARLRAGRRQTTLRARWRRCGDRHRVRLRARLDARDGCTRMTGTLRARGVPMVRFVAMRSTCGDGIVDAAGGEACDGERGCGAGAVCLADCRCEAPPRDEPTTTVPRETTTTTTASLPATTSTTVPALCGDGRVDVGEECDDGGAADGDGCSAGCALEAVFGGGGGEAADLCALRWGGSGFAPGAEVACADGAVCDRDPVAGRCAFLVFYCANVGLVTIGGQTACRPTDVARLGLAADAALAAEARETFLAAAAATLAHAGTAVAREGDTLAASPPVATRHLCGAFPLAVPAGTASVLAVEATDAAGTLDHDRMTFTCSEEPEP